MKIHKNVKLISLPLVAVAVTLGIGFSNVTNHSEHIKAASEKPNHNTFVLFKQEHEKTEKESKKPFIKINKKEFSTKDFGKFKDARNIIERSNGNSVLTEKQMKHEFIKENVLDEDADNQNIVVTKKEVEDFINQTRAQFNQLASDDPTRQVITDYISTLGISEDEYWTQYAVPAYEKALKIGKLKNRVFDNVKMKNKDATLDELNAEWEKYQEEEVNQAVVE